MQEVSCGVLSWEVCMFRVVLRPKTEPVDTESVGTQRGRRDSDRSIHGKAKAQSKVMEILVTASIVATFKLFSDKKDLK